MANSFLLRMCILLLWILNSRQQEECGRPIGSVSSGKIVGGYDIGYYKYPWYVALMRGGEVYCGGTLVSKKAIVTAAHCFQPFFKVVENGLTTFEKIFKPVLGVYNVCDHESTQKEFDVGKVYVHEKYKKQDPYFDIALVILTHEANGFEPCCLPEKALKGRSRPKEALVSGLGDQKYEARMPTCTMHEARILIYDDKVCKNMLTAQGEDGSKLKNAFCAGYLQGGIDACQGDSGGPLIIMKPTGRYDLLGITSFGFECAKPDTLGIYTDVSGYLDWLNKRIHENVPHGPSQTQTPSSVSIPIQNFTPTGITDETGVDTQIYDPTSSTFVAGHTTLNWSSYPVTPWEFATESAPDEYPYPSKKPPHGAHNPITIIINIFQKHKKDKHKHYRAHNGKKNSRKRKDKRQ